MYIKYDKSKVLTNLLEENRNYIDKVKAIAIGMVQTTESPATYYATDLKNKMPAHFLLDSESVVKYVYSSTNVFVSNMQDIIWKDCAKSFIEDTKTLQKDKATAINYLATTTDYLTKGTENRRGIIRTVKGITVHVAANGNTTATQERKQLENVSRENKQFAWHVCIDNANAIIAVPYKEMTYHCGAGDRDTIGVMLCRSGTQNITLTRAAKLISNLITNYNLTIEDVYRHSDWQSEKDCTATLFEDESWHNFLKLIEDDLTDVSKETKIDENIKLSPLRIESDTTNVIPNYQKRLDPGNHIMYVLVLNNLPKEQYYLIEDKLIRFLGDYLRLHQCDTSILYRLNDLLLSPTTCFPYYYNCLEDWNKLLECINQYMIDSKATPYYVEVQHTGVPLNLYGDSINDSFDDMPITDAFNDFDYEEEDEICICTSYQGEIDLAIETNRDLSITINFDTDVITKEVIENSVTHFKYTFLTDAPHEIIIYSASCITSLGDLSQYNISELDLSKAYSLKKF